MSRMLSMTHTRNNEEWLHDLKAQMLAAAQAAIERSNGFIDLLYRVKQARAENKIREVLDAQDFAKFSEEGRAMTVEQAVTFAFEPPEGI